MAVLSIRLFPDPLLKSPTRPVSRVTPSICRFVDDLIETMRSHTRCVGLAAPQIGSSLRIAVLDVTGHPKAPRGHGLVVLINPEIAGRQGASVQREGCLSIPDLTANVKRATEVNIRALDLSGKMWQESFQGFEAIAVQHEVDHLDGYLFLDRVADLKADVFQRKNYGDVAPREGKR